MIFDYFFTDSLDNQNLMMHKKVRKRLFDLIIFTRSQKIAFFFQILKKVSKARIKALFILLELCKQKSEVKYFFSTF